MEKRNEAGIRTLFKHFAIRVHSTMHVNFVHFYTHKFCDLIQINSNMSFQEIKLDRRVVL